MNISLKITLEVYKWRMNKNISKYEGLNYLLTFINDYDASSIPTFTKQFGESSQKDYKFLCDIVPVAKPLELMEVYKNELILLNRVLPIMKRQGLIYLNKILISDRKDKFSCIVEKFDKLEELNSLVYLANEGGISEVVQEYLMNGIKDFTKKEFESNWSEDTKKMGDFLISYAIRISNWEKCMDGEWIEVLHNGIIYGIEEVKYVQSDRNILPTRIAEYCYMLITNS